MFLNEFHGESIPREKKRGKKLDSLESGTVRNIPLDRGRTFLSRAAITITSTRLAHVIEKPRPLEATVDGMVRWDTWGLHKSLDSIADIRPCPGNRTGRWRHTRNASRWRTVASDFI